MVRIEQPHTAPILHVEVDRHCMPLGEFLTAAGESLTNDAAPFSAAFLRSRDAFVSAGLQALAATRGADGWVQLGIASAGEDAHRLALLRRISDTAHEWLANGSADEFFFMHKPPGLRLRFRACRCSAAELAARLRVRGERWVGQGLAERVEPGVYEPESQLFGGPLSMNYVHALFTVDALFWLDYHVRALERRPNDADISPAWLTSLTVLPTVFAGLDITGWEDLAVWDFLRRRCGRTLASPDRAATQSVVEAIRDLWSRRDLLPSLLDPAVAAIADMHRQAFRDGAAGWRAGYFNQPDARLGPRTAVAFFIVFHWNRARLSPVDQALVAEALSERWSS